MTLPKNGSRKITVNNITNPNKLAIIIIKIYFNSKKLHPKKEVFGIIPFIIKHSIVYNK